jgi:Zn-dependent peptidase ImmA (M78 family)
MQIPNKVRIGGIDYKVKKKPNPSDGNNNLCYGVFDSEHCIIELNSEREMHPDRLNQTFLHELLHGAIHGSAIESDDEESIVAAMARGLYQIICDNPKIFSPVKR